jgi:hypothetical protein
MPIENVKVKQDGYLYKTEWEFYFEDNSDIKHNVLSVTLPRMSLEHQNHITGLKFYTGVEFIDTVTVEFIEDSNYRVAEYLYRLLDTVYDRENRVWRTLSAVRGSPQVGGTTASSSEVLPRGIFTLYKGVRTPLQVSQQPVISLAYNKMRIKSPGDENTFSYEDGSPLTYSVTFAVDEIERLL